MDFHVLLFPEMVENTVQTSITGRAVKNGKIALHTVNIRDFADNKHSRVDDYPWGRCRNSHTGRACVSGISVCKNGLQSPDAFISLLRKGF